MKYAHVYALFSMSVFSLPVDNTYFKEGAITKKFHEDALEIAIATINKVDVLVSWNFKHIVNLDRIKKV